MTNNEKKNKDNQLRCECGRLYLVITKDSFEFKCPRCKRVHVLKFEELKDHPLTKHEVA
jgi:phage FluMu protein Com